MAAKKTSALYARCVPRMLERLEAVRGDETAGSFIRRHIEAAIVALERANLRAAAEARQLGADVPSDRAPLDLDGGPTKTRA